MTHSNECRAAAAGVSTAFQGSCATRTAGDLDLNGVVEVNDAIRMLEMIAHLEPEQLHPCSDANHDGDLNILDPVVTLNVIVGNREAEPCGA
jgi:hypothetical protein